MARPLKVKNLAPDDPVEKSAARILRIRLKEFYSHWPDYRVVPSTDPLHSLRISGKRLRYTAEAVRHLYPDRLTLLVEMLKRTQDILGEIQDCVTQKEIISEDMKRMRRRHPDGPEHSAIEQIIAGLDVRRESLLAQFQELWAGMTLKEFRVSLKAMIKNAEKRDHGSLGKQL